MGMQLLLWKLYMQWALHCRLQVNRAACMLPIPLLLLHVMPLCESLLHTR